MEGSSTSRGLRDIRFFFFFYGSKSEKDEESRKETVNERVERSGEEET